MKRMMRKKRMKGGRKRRNRISRVEVARWPGGGGEVAMVAQLVVGWPGLHAHYWPYCRHHSTIIQHLVYKLLLLLFFPY